MSTMIAAQEGHGSPPRAWGRRGAKQAASKAARFTPTCVGTAGGDWSGLAVGSVHPHVRGDGVVRFLRRTPGLGSPPRAWGRRHRGRNLVLVTRFTPTCVGTAGTWVPTRPSKSVHPHVRGDGVGRTHESGEFSVHPHVRGDGPSWRAEVHGGDGSPPRAWGRLTRSPGPLDGVRFTPTCVGTASKPSLRHLRISVHPHVRGDGRSDNPCAVVSIGSPPRAWGRLL